MDKYEQTFLKTIKEDIQQIGYIEDENQRLHIFDSVIKSLMLIKDEKIHENITKFKKNMQEYDKQITKKQEEINTIIEEKNKNINNFYKEFLVKL